MNPLALDTDGDGLPDGADVGIGIDPSDPEGPPKTPDTDGWFISRFEGFSVVLAFPFLLWLRRNTYHQG